jgi:hypothetical protein
MRRAVAMVLVLAAATARGEEGTFLSEADAPRAVFPQADAFDRHEVAATPERRARVTAHLDGALPSLWEVHRIGACKRIVPRRHDPGGRAGGWCPIRTPPAGGSVLN